MSPSDDDTFQGPNGPQHCHIADISLNSNLFSKTQRKSQSDGDDDKTENHHENYHSVIRIRSMINVDSVADHDSILCRTHLAFTSLWDYRGY